MNEAHIEAINEWVFFLHIWDLDHLSSLEKNAQAYRLRHTYPNRFGTS